MALFDAVAVPKKKKRLALFIAGAADLLQLGGMPLFLEGAMSLPDIAVDAIVAALLWAVLGFQKRLLFALAAELTPFAVLFPTWTAVVLSLPVAPDAPPEKP